MISPELLRRYPFFGSLADNQLKAVAMIAQEDSEEEGTTLFEENQPAEALFLLLEGSVDLYYISEEEYHPKGRKEFWVGEVNPGEIYAISGLIEPYIYTATARASKPIRFVRIGAAELRALLDLDCKMGYNFMRQLAKLAIERLNVTRVQLAACQG
jgi:CRP/FNR family cyclic AMP-dependent transcriptional regulator